jgi:hypothetical protein
MGKKGRIVRTFCNYIELLDRTGESHIKKRLKASINISLGKIPQCFCKNKALLTNVLVLPLLDIIIDFSKGYRLL